MTSSTRVIIVLLCLDALPLRVTSVSGSFSKDDNLDTNQRDYTGHTLIRATPLNDSHVALLTSLEESTDASEQPNITIQFWNRPNRVKRQVDVLISPERVDSVSSELKKAGLHYDVISDNVQSVINDQVRQVRSALSDERSLTRSSTSFNLSNYHTYNDINRWLDQKCSSGDVLCQVTVIGKSYENRDIKVVRIGANDFSKPAIWIDAGIHAREWIAPSTALLIINKLMDSSDRNSRYLVTKFRWYILPLANPDGYAFTWTSDRLWRKTRSKHPRVKCIGTDFNRNWAFHWGGPGTSNKSCSEDYCGPTPFSEPETRAMSEFLLSLQRQARRTRSVDGSLAAYVSLHSYGQHWLTPWGYTHQYPDDYDDLVSMATPAVEAIRRATGKRYTVGQAARSLYLASGGSDDWAKAVAGIKYAYTVELRDAGKFGFLLPPSAIEPTGNEIYQSMRTLALGILRERRLRQPRKRRH